MFIDYLQKCSSVQTQWTKAVPGISICRLGFSDAFHQIPGEYPIRQPDAAFEIFFCTGGCATLILEGSYPCEIRKHHILLLTHPDRTVSVLSQKNLQGIIIAVDAQLAHQEIASACAALGLDMDMDYLKRQMLRQPEQTVLIHNSWSQAIFDLLPCLPERMWGNYCLFKAVELLYILAGKNKLPVSEQENLHSLQTLLDAQAYMEEHLSEKITISALSRVLLVSPTYLKTEFRRIYGTSVHRWLIDLRMRRAGELIRHSDLPLYCIAQSVGYEGMSQFITAFKKYHGATPGEYRKMSKTVTSCPF